MSNLDLLRREKKLMDEREDASQEALTQRIQSARDILRAARLERERENPDPKEVAVQRLRNRLTSRMIGEGNDQD